MLARAMLLASLALTGLAAHAQVARVLETKGASIVERPGAAPRILGAGATLDARDTVSVARDSWAILEFSDRTRLTLRQDSVFKLESYRASAPSSVLPGLMKGGLRAVNRTPDNRNPRGTDFDARLCDADCSAEERQRPAAHPSFEIAARIVEMKGTAATARAGDAPRLMVQGAAIHEGEELATRGGSYAVLVFRDGARITLAEKSRLLVNRFRFKESEPRQGQAYLTLLSGNAQVWTGRLAKVSPDAFLVESAMGVIRPHGTGFSVSGCIGNACASASANVDSGGASGSASGSAGGQSAGASGSANSSGVSGSTTTPGGTTSASAGSGGATFASSGVAGTTTANVGAGGVSGSRTTNLPGGTGVSVSASAGSSGASGSATTPVNAVSVNAGSGGATVSTGTSAGGTTASVGSGGATLNTSGPTGTTTASAGPAGANVSKTTNLPGGNGVTVSLGAGSDGASGSATTPVTSANLNAGSGGVSASTKGPVGGSTVTVGAGGATLNSSGIGGTTTASVGPDGVSGSKTTNLPAGAEDAAAKIAAEAKALADKVGTEVQPPPGDPGRSATDLGRAASILVGADNGGGVLGVVETVVATVKRAGDSAADKVGSEIQPPPAGKVRIPGIADPTPTTPTGSANLPLPTLNVDGNKMNSVVDTVRTGVENANDATNAAVATQAANALNAAADPIVRELTALMTQIRNNPPQTEAAARQLDAQISGLVGQLQSATETGATLAGAAANSTAVKTAIGSYWVLVLEILADFGSWTLSGLNQTFMDYTVMIHADPYLSAAIASVGASYSDVERMLASGSAIPAMAILRIEVADFLIQGTSATLQAAFEASRKLAVAAQQDSAPARAAAERAAAPVVAAGQAAADRIAADVSGKLNDARTQVENTSLSPGRFTSDAARKGGAFNTYDITGGTVLSSALPDYVAPPAQLRTTESIPTVTQDGDRTITRWIETIVPGSVSTTGNATVMEGTVIRTEVQGPDGIDTTVEFRGITFLTPKLTSAGTPVPALVGVLIDINGQGLSTSTHSSAANVTSVTSASSTTSGPGLEVWDGSVEVAGRGMVGSGEMMRTTATGTVVTERTLASNTPGGPRPDLVKVDPNLFAADPKNVDPGLYVWVREGEVAVTRNDQTVIVQAGNAVAALEGRLASLDTVPNFLRFDATPGPGDKLAAISADTFRAPDGSTFGACKVR